MTPTPEQVEARHAVLRAMFERERELHHRALHDRSTRALLAERGIDRNRVVLAHWLACHDIGDLHSFARFDTEGGVA